MLSSRNVYHKRLVNSDPCCSYRLTILALPERHRAAVPVQRHPFLSPVSAKIHTLGEVPHYALKRGLGGPQSRSGRYGGAALTITEIRTPDRAARSLVTILTELLRLWVYIVCVWRGGHEHFYRCVYFIYQLVRSARVVFSATR